MTTVEPHEDGSLVRVLQGTLVHTGDGAATTDAVRAAVSAHLARLREELVRRAGTERLSADPEAPPAGPEAPPAETDA